jgi:hypothetical protein
MTGCVRHRPTDMLPHEYPEVDPDAEWTLRTPPGKIQTIKFRNLEFREPIDFTDFIKV